MPRLSPPGRGVPPEHSAAALGGRGSRIRRPVRSLRRHARVVAFVVLGLAGVASTTPAAAQPASAYEHVRNVDQDPISIVFTGRDHSQRFTTGSYSRGYSLTDVAIGTEDSRSVGNYVGYYLGTDLACTGSENFIVDTEGSLTDPEGSLTECPFVVDEFSVSVCRVLASGYPDRDSCTLLTPPSSFEPGFLTFIAPEVADPNGIGVEKIELAPNTTYTLLTVAAEVEGRDASVLYRLTESDNEDTESSPGWSIWNDYDHYDSSDDSWAPDSYAQAHRVQISATKGHSTAVITSVAVTAPPQHGLYGTGDIIEFTVTLSDRVTVEGDPVFIISLGGVDKEARYDAERSTATSLVFRYTVQPGDEVADGIWIGNGPGTFRLDEDDHIRTLRSLRDALLDHDVVGTLSDHRVAPTTVQTLVSNVRQPSGTTQSSVTGHPSLAQAFTTGSNAAGYGLYSIRINVADVHYEPPGPLTASIWTTNAQGRPQTRLFGLTGPASITTTGPKTFTANTALEASTTYALVLTDVLTYFGANGGNIGLGTASTAEDGAPGWSIANTALRKLNSSRWYIYADGPLRVEFTGTILANSTDATLRGLALSAAANDSSIALSPSFASSITSYTASVASGVDAITIAPTPTNNGARVAYLDGSDTAIPDADTTKSGQQVPLAVNTNTIKVKVTAEDGAMTKTYTVTVTRTPASAQARVAEAEVIEAEATVTSTPQLTSDTYGAGETIAFTVTFSEAVTVEGAPAFRFSLGNAGLTQGVARVAAYDAGRSTATKLVFTYEVQARDEDTDGIWVGDHTQTFSSLDANNHITANNAAAILTHSPLGLLTGHKVDGSRAPAPAATTADRDRYKPRHHGRRYRRGRAASPSQDEHGNTPGQATAVHPGPRPHREPPGQLNTAADVDYFTVDLPHAGAVVVETSGFDRHRGHGVARWGRVSHRRQWRGRPELLAQCPGRPWAGGDSPPRPTGGRPGRTPCK